MSKIIKEVMTIITNVIYTVNTTCISESLGLLFCYVSIIIYIPRVCITPIKCIHV